MRGVDEEKHLRGNTIKIIHVIAGLGVHNGGPSYSVPRLCAALDHLGCESSLLTVREAQGEPSDPNAEAYRHSFGQIPVVSSLRLSSDLRRALSKRAASVDIIHNHGLWLLPNVDAGRVAARAAKPLVVSPRGMLANAALKFSPKKKALFWALIQRDALASAAAWHATSAEEADDIRAYGIQGPVAVIPNGVDLPDAVASHGFEKPTRTLLFLSRLHPKKGLPDLIAAWSRVAQERPNWNLVIAGPDEAGHRSYLEKQITQLGASRIRFTGAVSGVLKSELFETADLFVLPTQNENFGIAVAEALANGIPTIVTRGAPWNGLEIERCGWWIDHGVEPLVAALREAMALPSSERQAMGQRGRAWIEKDFSWDSIGRDMSEVYRWLLGRAERPPCVIYP